MHIHEINCKYLAQGEIFVGLHAIFLNYSVEFGDLEKREKEYLVTLVYQIHLKIWIGLSFWIWIWFIAKLRGWISKHYIDTLNPLKFIVLF